ncbi:hypothetical protein A2634_01345 [Candidatus Amesbacteria bacterium RIFCSPHIGHO2_01_FULL_48_32]|uniref:Uncharacterized protein n=1 Tax=Candidatus Amesbacteria bacterium RIFCSPLOWO2_01_FULL_48_25 TaxID=1797259 RepID=A0A1F4ZD87_9BACT|nr:MAG: hypothetical protein A2634_01345 [Candidatus Amesbacteria bacterium RIFCSPHIGHO2_01_FULL_48_32]OGD03687.1 MAG: hypothetical protein A2989_03330 [Candidatus Amesbacteria bacterium RIFCSPLOWO2_01_FULL_48_25]HJZ05964.1 hypothetical protein [Patescibacteria group bacterium]
MTKTGEIAKVAKAIASRMAEKRDSRLFSEEPTTGADPREAGWIETGETDGKGRKILVNKDLPGSKMYEAGDNFEVVDD